MLWQNVQKENWFNRKKKFDGNVIIWLENKKKNSRNILYYKIINKKICQYYAINNNTCYRSLDKKKYNNR